MTKTYTTIQGDMFDSIAYKVYGSVKYMDVLIRANRKYCDVQIFSSGVVLEIPEIDTATKGTDLPPWKAVSK